MKNLYIEMLDTQQQIKNTIFWAIAYMFIVENNKMAIKMAKTKFDRQAYFSKKITHKRIIVDISMLHLFSNTRNMLL